jgi:hypothetical protein
MLRLWDPTARPEADQGLEHGVAGPPSRLHVTVAAGSETLNATVASGTQPELGGPEVTLTVGVAGKTVQLWLSVPVPPAFDASMTTVCTPGRRPDADHGLEHGVAAPPSRLHVTVAVGSETLNGTVAFVVDDDPGPPVTVTTGAGGKTVQL